MGAIVARRLGAGLFTLLAMITLTFVVYWAVPTQPAHFVYPRSRVLSPFEVQRGNHLLGVDRPKLVQYASYLGHLVRGDFGKAWTGVQVSGDSTLISVPVGPQLFTATALTLSILFGGALLVLLLSLPLGAVAARLEGSAFDRAISLLTLVGICTHPMVVGLVLRTVFGNKLGWLPAGGYCSLLPHPAHATPATDYLITCSGPGLWAEHLVLPWLSFAFLFLALYTRMTRTSVLETMHEDFVRTARAKGASEARLVGLHVLPHAGLRVLTMLGMEVGTALGIAVYIESAFGMPGLGRLAVQVLSTPSALDLPQILAVVTMITAIVVVGNAVVDVLYAFVDPRAGASLRARRGRAVAGLV